MSMLLFFFLILILKLTYSRTVTYPGERRTTANQRMSELFLFRPLFHVSVSGSGCVSVSVCGRFQCGHPIQRFSIRQTYLPVFTLL